MDLDTEVIMITGMIHFTVMAGVTDTARITVIIVPGVTGADHTIQDGVTVIIPGMEVIMAMVMDMVTAMAVAGAMIMLSEAMRTIDMATETPGLAMVPGVVEAVDWGARLRGCTHHAAVPGMMVQPQNQLLPREAAPVLA